MARIAGVNLPKNKKIGFALPYIYGVGQSLAKKILAEAKVDPEKRTDVLEESDVARIREVLEAGGIKVEGDLRREIGMNIKRLVDLGCYRGLRHKKGLPVRGQRTHSNARTRKGKAKPIAGKRSVKALK